MKKLDQWGIANNTLLIFMSDNGTSGGLNVYNYGMKGKKGTVNEGGARVPLFLRLPGKIKQGVDVDRLARHYDIFSHTLRTHCVYSPLDKKTLVRHSETKLAF